MSMNQPFGRLPGGELDPLPIVIDNCDKLPAARYDERPLIILVSSGYHLYREYLLKMVSHASRVWLFLNQEPSWEKQYVVGHTIVDTLDPQAMIKAARKLADEMAVRGVLCWDEVRMPQSAELAQALGLPGGDPVAIGRCRDKHQTRTALAAAGVPQAESMLVGSLEQAWEAAERIGYPVVVKPRALGASFGVSGVASPAGLDAAYCHARSASEEGVPFYESGVLVEEYLDGPEISLDAACSGGLLTPMFLAHKITGFPPHFEEIGHVVDAADPLLHQLDLLDVLQRAHRAVGFANGVTHSEVRLTSRGPKIIEINCRLGGDLIPYVGFLASGIDPGRIAVQVACGVQPDIKSIRRRVAAVRFYYPDRDVTVADVQVAQHALPSSIDVARPLAGPGQRLVLPPEAHVTSRYAYAVAVDSTADGCQAALDAAEQAITLRIEESK
jgi:biotin carboxylase